MEGEVPIKLKSPMPVGNEGWGALTVEQENEIETKFGRQCLSAVSGGVPGNAWLENL